jgi:hypothetical protein
MSPTVRRAIMGSVLTPVGKVLKLAGLSGLARNVTHMFYPNDPSRASGNRHYLNINGQWVTTGVTMTGVMDATGVVTGGTFSYLAPVGTVETYQITWANGGSPVVSFCIGFNRSLTAAERTALGQAAFWAQLFAGTAILTADCTGETGEALTVDGTVITVDGGVVTVEV